MQDAIQKKEHYQQRKNRLISDAGMLHKAGHKLALGKKTSNLFRNRQQASHRLNVTDFNHVLDVNIEQGWVDVEAMTTFSELVHETLKFGYLPLVVPELKSITVGGALTGIAIESSSFRYGLVHETIIEFEVMLGDGRTLTCTKDNEHRDLFYGFANTYGSLGYALKLKMKIIKAKPFVKLTHLHFTDPKAYFNTMQKVCHDNRNEGEVAFIDGSIFSENDLHLSLGEFVDEVPFVSDYKWMSIYYRSIKQRDQDYLATLDYIWRWDTDWFWCSKNFLMQNSVMRFLFGRWMLKSTSYWNIMRFARNNAIVKWLTQCFTQQAETVIQDIEVPIDKAVKFNAFFHKKIGIKPVWVCPVQTSSSRNPYTFYHLDESTLFVNFGFWDTVPSGKKPDYYNRLIEQKVAELSGHKSLYSDVFYSESEFWTIYNKDQYRALKNKYDPHNALADWYTKISVK